MDSLGPDPSQSSQSPICAYSSFCHPDTRLMPKRPWEIWAMVVPDVQ
jgi:hypothetical protein